MKARLARPWGALLVVLSALGLGVACRSAMPGADEPLPVDSSLVIGRLDNGLAYVVKRHGNPAGRLSVWLHVHAGSLNETEETRGLAHFLEHMAFNGSANFPPGSVIPLFQSLGMTFGRDQNAFTGLEQTTYTLSLPDTAAATVDKGFLFLADVASRLTFPGAEIESERRVVLEEKRAGAGASRRVQDYVLERLAPESTLGRRLPIGTEEGIGGAKRADFVDFYTRWYTSGNMTVIAVGDADAGTVVDAIRRHFGLAPAAPRAPPSPVGVQPTRGTRAIVATDPELKRAEVSLIRVEPARGPITTVAAWRRQLVERIGIFAFDRRMRAQIAEGRADFLEASASASEWGRAIRVISAQAAGSPGAWRGMLSQLGEAVQRARLHGFSDREIDDARRAFIARAEEAVGQEATRPARAVMGALNRSVTRREPAMAAAQERALLDRLLPGIEAPEVSRVFAEVFDPTDVIVVAELPASGALPTETELARLGRVAVSVSPAPAVETARADRLLPALPPLGVVTGEAVHPATGVASAWLGNGVRVHHRAIPERRGEATIVITLAGGEIEETAGNRGISLAAVLAWSRPATARLSSVQIRDLMIGKKTRVDGHAGEDSLTLTVSGAPADLETGLQLAHLLLTDPRIEPVAFAQWQEAERQRIKERRTQPRGVLADTLADALYPAGDVRPRPLRIAQVDTLTLEAAQAWLQRHLDRAPMEVAVVGDIDRAAALALVARYLGSLPARGRIGPDTLAALRKIPPPARPVDTERTVETRTEQAVVLEGFRGPDLTATRDVRLLNLASRILSTRMSRVIREEKGLVYSIGAHLQPGREYPGFGLFAARAPTDPAKAAALSETITAMYADFATAGPTAEEVAVAARQLVNLLDEVMKTPSFWIGRLATLDYRGLNLDEIAGAAAAYPAFTATEVREAFARFYRPDTRVRAVVLPRTPN